MTELVWDIKDQALVPCAAFHHDESFHDKFLDLVPRPPLPSNTRSIVLLITKRRKLRAMLIQPFEARERSRRAEF
jgi:hypothetical protein